jgi:predicted DCC family thiol-disulfide oxidoreductase YuxK
VKQPPAPTADVERDVVLFDGPCNLCNGTVRFIVRHDPAGRFRFASLQSEAGRRLLAVYDSHIAGADSVVLIRNGRAFVESDAAIHIAASLGWPWRALGGLRVVPRPLRDAAYGFVARNRHRWFGKDDHCALPTPELARRTLPDPVAETAG